MADNFLYDLFKRAYTKEKQNNIKGMELGVSDCEERYYEVKNALNL